MRFAQPDRLLRRLAHLLGRAAIDDAVDAVVGVTIGPDGVDVHLRPAGPGEHVVELLCGFDAPARWDAVGVIAHGHAYPAVSRHRSRPVSGSRPHPSGDGGAGPAADTAPEAVVVVHLQARSGHCCSLVGPPSGPLRGTGSDGSGRLAEVCRRSLGLSTDPPAAGPLHWWAALWLDRLTDLAHDGPPLDEATLVAHFPGGRPFVPGDDLAALDAHARLLESVCPWPSLRRAAAAGTVAVPGVDPDLAAWMDDGMFARWSVAELVPCPAALHALRPRLHPGLAGPLETVLAGWGVLGAGRPRP